jgi:hypothetical protein
MWRLEWDIKAAFVRAGHLSVVKSKIRLLTYFFMALRTVMKNTLFSVCHSAHYNVIFNKINGGMLSINGVKFPF